MAGRVAVGFGVLDVMLGGRPGPAAAGRRGVLVTARMVTFELLLTADTEAGVVLVVVAGDDAAARTEICTAAPSLSGTSPLTGTDPWSAVVAAAVDATASDECLALLPMMRTMPISTPMVTLKADAVTTTAAFFGTAPSPSAATGRLLGSL